MPRHKTGGSYQPGENHKGWKGGTEDYWHRKARELTNCPKGLVVHHKDGMNTNNMQENLAILCQSCHCRLHNTKKLSNLSPKLKELKICLI